jgi:hypothetical protein
MASLEIKDKIRRRARGTSEVENKNATLSPVEPRKVCLVLLWKIGKKTTLHITHKFGLESIPLHLFKL